MERFHKRFQQGVSNVEGGKVGIVQFHILREDLRPLDQGTGHRRSSLGNYSFYIAFWFWNVSNGRAAITSAEKR
jgi:hypothetical protein